MLDSDNRGTYQFAISSVNGLAGLSTTTITSGEDYTIGGFTARNGTFPTRTAHADIFVNVSALNNPLKLIVTIANLPGVYYDNTDDYSYTTESVHRYTIVSTTSPNTFDAAGNAIRLNEPIVVGSNTSGSMGYTIEEEE